MIQTEWRPKEASIEAEIAARVNPRVAELWAEFLQKGWIRLKRQDERDFGRVVYQLQQKANNDPHYRWNSTRGIWKGQEKRVQWDLVRV